MFEFQIPKNRNIRPLQTTPIILVFSLHFHKLFVYSLLHYWHQNDQNEYSSDPDL